MLKILAPILVAATLSACGTTTGNLKYSASAEQPPKASVSSQTVTVGRFQDERDGDKNWLGVIRGGFGNHLKTLEASQPVPKCAQPCSSNLGEGHASIRPYLCSGATFPSAWLS